MVHHYAKINLDRVYDILQSDLTDFEDYLRWIDRYLP